MAEARDRAQDRAEVDRLAAEFLERYRRGDWPHMAEYLRAYPHLEEGIREVFPSLLVRERLGAAGPDGADAAEPPPSAGPPSRRIGPYDTLVLLGSGGQGDVWLAEDSRLRRRVALKVLPRDRAFGSKALDRFRREAAITARLDHPGICTVFEAGEDDGVPWIAMRYVEGEILAQWTAAARGEVVERADPGVARVTAEVTRSIGDVRTRDGALRIVEIVEKAARALHAAHEAGLVHRDIKPGNIVVTAEREPVLLDFGLAREESDDSALTLTGALMGTPAYMSPEQLTADRIRLDRRTDVYSLGVTLYECLTLHLPFEAPTREALYQKILVSDPEDSRRHNPRIPADLEVVLQTAMEKDRDRRYGTALEFAEDLRRVRASEPIHARPAGPVLRLGRWAQRNPATAGAAGALLLALTAGLTVSLALLAETRRERDAKEEARAEADRQRRDAESARDATARALRRARALGLASASFEAEQRDPSVALHLALRAAEVEVLPPVVERLHGALAAAREVAALEHGDRVVALAWSPAGDRLATACADGKGRLWDAAGRPVAVLAGHGGPVHDVAFSEAGDRILTVSEDATARLWSTDGTGVAVLRGHAAAVRYGAMLPGGGWITGSADGTARLWGPTGEEGPVLAAGGGRVDGIAVAPGGKVVAVGGADGSARVFDRAGRLLATVQEPADRHSGLGALAFSPAGDLIVTGGRPGGHLWDLAGTPVAALEGHINLIRDAAFSPDGTLVATQCTEGSVGLFRVDGTPLHEFDVPPQSLGTVEFSPDGRHALACGADHALHVFDVETRKEVMDLRGHRGHLLEARYSRDGGLIASASADGTARIWRVWPGEIAAVAPVWPREVVRVAVSRDRPLLAMCSWKREEVRVFDLRGTPVADLRGHRGVVRSVGFLPGGSTVITSAADGTVRLWDPETGAPRVVIETGFEVAHAAGRAGSDGPLYAIDGEQRIGLWDLEGNRVATIVLEEQRGVPRLAFAPRGDLVAAGTSAGAVRVFRSDGTPLRHWTLDPRASVTALAFAPSGERIVTGGAGGGVAIWDLDGNPLANLVGHGAAVRGAAWSADGRLVLTWSLDLTARLWDADGTPRAVLRGHLGEIGGAGFLPAGDRVLTYSRADGSARTWDLDGRPVDLLRIPGNPVVQCAPVDEGRRVVALHEDGSVRVWTLDPGELRDVARARAAVRPLAEDERARYADLLGGEPAAPR